MRKLLVVFGALLFVFTVAAPAFAAPVDRRITDPRITESSGLTPSLRFPNVFWTHNDSGNPPNLYAIGASGSTRATLRLTGEPDVDWEAITSFRSAAGPVIAVGDIGDNNAVHPSVRVAMVREPSALKDATVTPFKVLRLRYPDGPRDAETLMTDPRNGILYIVSKTFFGADLYQVPESIWPVSGGPRVTPITRLKRVATLQANFITDGAFLPDGRMVLRGYGRVYVLDRPETAKDDTVSILASAALPSQDQGESIAIVDGGKSALIGSEGKREPVYKITLPEVPADKGTPTLPPSSGKSPNPSPTPVAASPAGNADDLRVWAAVIGGALLLMALTGTVYLTLTRHR